MSESRKNLSRAHLLKEIYFNRTGLVFVITVLLAIGMFALAAHTHGNASAFWLTLATGIIATSAFAAFTALLTTRKFDSFLRTTIEHSVDLHFSAAANELLGAMQRQHSGYVPITSYPAANSPNAGFNRDLNRSFMSSERYIFQGVTARYNVARLAALDTRFDLIRIVVADPTKPDSVVTRAKHDLDDDPRGADLTHARAELIDDIWMSIVGAYLCWRKADRIEFCLLADPPIDRSEIFDTDMFLTLYSDPASWGFIFPATCRFLRDSMPYQMQVKDCARLFTSRYTARFQIPRSDEPTALFRATRKVGLTFDETQYERLKGEFLSLRRNLPEQMIPDHY